jgi:hypothetical protein
VAKLLVPVSAMLLGFWLIMTVVSIDHGWPAELGGAGDPNDVSGEWASRGTLFSPPLVPLVAQVVLTALALLRRRLWQIVAGAGLAALGVVYVVAGLLEPFDPTASDPHVALYWFFRVLGVGGGAALAVTGSAAALAAWRSGR